jgi:phosphatidylglycerol:prolipoprotein diacylglycerol transferase
MHPEIFKIGKLVIHSYGFMLAASFLFGIWLASYRAKKNNLDSNVIADVGFWIILSAIIGARLYYVILHFDEFSGNLTGIFNPFHGDSLGIGGLVMYGGIIGALIAGFFFFKIKKLPFLPYADAIAPAVGFGIFLTRIGCFLNGCCYGKSANGGFGVHFPEICPAGHYQAAINASKLIPSQLYLSAGGLAIGIIILVISKKKTFDGFQFYLTVVLYSILRFSVDFTRYYSKDERIATLSHNQIVCIILFIIFAGLILKNFISTSELAPEPVVEEAKPVVDQQEVETDTDNTPVNG